MKEHSKVIIYFLASILITYIFIAANPVYTSFSFQLLALSIAAGVWGVQVMAAFLFLREKKFIFLYHTARLCFWGSACLLLSVLVNYFIGPSFSAQLIISGVNVLFSVLVMLIMFVIFLRRLQLSFAWVILWLLCLCIAVPLQAKLVGMW